MFIIDTVMQIIFPGNTFSKFLQAESSCRAAPLLRSISLITVQRIVPGKPSHKSLKAEWSGWRNRIPGLHVGIIHAFLRILMIIQDIPGDSVAVMPVLFLCTGDRDLIPAPVKPDDLIIIHRCLPETV